MVMKAVRATAPFLGVLFLGALSACGSVLVPTDDAASTAGATSVGGADGAGGGGADGASTGTGGTVTTGPTCEGPLCTAPERIVKIAEGNPRCAVRASGKAICWGLAFFSDDHSPDAPPWEQAGLDDAISAAGLMEHMCFLLGSGQVACEGNSHHAQLGLAVPVNTTSASPVVLPELANVVQLSSGHHHVCAVLAGGQAVCWGGPYSPSLGDPDVYETQAPIPVVGIADAAQISATMEHTCAVRTSGQVMCWGWNHSGELGDGGKSEQDTPVAVVGIPAAAEVASGWSHTCARTASGHVWCWGDIGLTPGAASTTTPFEIPDLDDAIQLSAGYGRSCALRANGDIVCWGSHPYIGSGDGTRKTIPVHGAVHVASGAKDSCAALANGDVSCWVDQETTLVEGLY